MANSMQQLIIQNRQTNNNNYNRIAWDLSFLCIEWIFIELKEILKTAMPHAVNLKVKALIAAEVQR